MRLSLRSSFSSLTQYRTFDRNARLFLLSTIINGIIVSAWSLFFNFFILARGYDKAYLGLVNSMPSIAALALSIPFGLLSDRIGRRLAMFLGLLVATVAMGLQVWVWDARVILLMAFLSGAGNTLYLNSQAPYMMAVSGKDNRILLFSLNFGLLTLSGAVGNLFAGQMPAFFSHILHVSEESAVSYQAVLLASVVVSALALVPLFLLKETRGLTLSREEQPRKPLGQVLLRPIVLKLFLPNLLIGSGASLIVPYVNVFYAERFHVSDQALGALFSGAYLIVTLSSFIGPVLVELFRDKIRTVVFSQAASLVFLLLMGFSGFAWLSMIGYLGRAFFINIASPLYSAFSMEQIPTEDQGAVNSLLGLSWQVGWVIGPYISGVVQEIYGFTPLYVGAWFLYALTCASVWYFFHPRRFAANIPIEVGGPLDPR
ncbi:MAG: MFS transporter [Chloroflexi bacterium]|nr:MFS transporter [Chloroflexota bacterium]